MKTDLVNFKGMGDGVRIWLDAAAPMGDILAELEARIDSSKAFFGDGNCNIRFFSRRLTAGEKLRLEEVMHRLLPLCRIGYEDKASHSNDWLMQYKERYGIGENVHPAAEVAEHMDPVPKEEYEGSKVVTEEEFLSVFRSNRARLYQGFAHDGMTIRSDGHLVFFGEVEKGATLIAVGNIIVIGGLYGSAHAGCNGHNGSYIMAMDMKPEGLAIADLVEQYRYEADPSADKMDDAPEPVKKSFFDKFKKKNELPQKDEEKQHETVYSAVALCKNNKIVFDNFTIKTFTNSKNMV